MLWIRWIGLLLLTSALVSCGNKKVPAPTAPASPSTQWEPTQALTNLPRVRLWIGSRELDAELCITTKDVATGLMFRSGIQDDDIMLFVFSNPSQKSFYMKNVDFDIDLAYINADGTISQIVRLKANDANPVPSRSDNIQFVLEAAPGWFAKNNFKEGTLIRLPQGSLRDVLGPRGVGY